MSATITPLSEFMGHIKAGKFTRRYDYDVVITPPAGITYGGATKGLSFRCESFAMPGQNIETSPDNIRIGPIREHAFGVNYAPVTGVFLCDDKFSEKKFFDEWQELMFDRKTFKTKFYKDYVADMSVTQYGPRKTIVDEFGGGEGTKQEAIYECKLINAFPKSVIQMDLNIADGELHRLSVEFQYHHWET